MALSKIKAGSLAVDAVTSAAIADGAIVIADLADGSVTSAKLATMTTDVSFGDNAKVSFGASNDLQIYHTSTLSQIQDSGTGELRIASNGTAIRLWDTANLQNLAAFNIGGKSSIYFNGSEKLATSSSGVDVTGTLVADGLTVDTATDVEINCSNSFDGINITGSNVNGAGGRLQILATGASGTGRSFAIYNDSRSSFDEIKFQANTDFAFSDFDTGDNRFRIADNGDISFYEDTGTTAKFFWDASAEALGIGTSSPNLITTSSDSHVDIRGGSFGFLQVGTSATKTTSDVGYLEFMNGNNTRLATVVGGADGANNDGYMRFSTASGGSFAERMRIDSSGFVGIGTSSPANPLHITKEIAGYQAYFNNDNGSAQGVKVRIKANDPGNFNILELVSASTLSDVTAMVVRDDGNVGIGTSSPSKNLHIATDASGEGILIKSTGSTSNTLDFDANRSGAGNSLGSIRAFWDGNGVAGIYFNAGTDTTNKDDGFITFGTTTASTGENSTERMRIDSSGNVGIGTTSPSTYGKFVTYSSGGYTAIDVNGQISSYQLLDVVSAGGRLYGGSSQGLLGYIGIEQAANGAKGGRILFSNCASGSNTPTEAMRIDPSGNVGIGTSSPESELSVDGSVAISSDASTVAPSGYDLKIRSGTSILGIHTNNNSGVPTLEFGNGGAGHSLIKVTNTVPLKFEINAIERMRLKNNGRMVFKSPTNTNAAYQDALIDWINENEAGVMTRIACYREAGPQAPAALTFHTTNNVDTTANNSDGNISEKFRIASNGDLTATDTSISSNSDQRLKQNIQDFEYDLETFKQLQTHTFDWKEPHLHGDKSGVRGFVAQELEVLDPYWVQEIEVQETSDDYQYLPDTHIPYGENNPYKPEDAAATDIERIARFAKTSKLGQKDAMYVSVIQQMLAKIETLETENAQIKARLDALEN